jgi:hypothetical protein
MLTIKNGITPFSSPTLIDPPLGGGCIDNPWTINPGAVDPDGDILKYRLIKCEIKTNTDVTGYKFPQELDPTGLSTFTVDSLRGTISWKSPSSLQGDYNIAIRIEKWRNGVLIGWVIRDWQVIISAACIDMPPVIDPIPDMCVVAGKTLTYVVTGSQAKNDTLIFDQYYGTPFDVPNPATFTVSPTDPGSVKGTFNWITNISHFRKNPYQVYYKVKDKQTGLTFPATHLITILATPVQNVNATIFQRGFNVKWEPSVYPQAIGYNIYRRTGVSTVPFDSCTTGVPLNSGYTLAGTVNDPTKVIFQDLNNGKGLASGYNYCYVVTALFADGAESAPSTPYCAPLMIPFIRVIQDTLTQCVGNTVVVDSTIIVFESADANTKYNWTSTPALKIADSNKMVPSITMITPGIHPVKIVSVSGVYTDSATIYFNVRAIPAPLIKLVDLGGMPDTVMFYNRSFYDVSSDWLFWDGTRSKSMDSVQFVFDHNGYYRTYLTVYNNLGCPDTTSILYRVTMKGLAIPNAFEPENTKNVDLTTFKPKALGLKTFYMGIWDLWGNLIWSTDKVNQYQEPLEGWNGNDIKGRKMPSQNYIWRMNATYVDGTVWKGVKDHFGNFHKEGTFTLLR